LRKPVRKDEPARDEEEMIPNMSFAGLPVRLDVGDPADQEE
jgi:hypothetical protein